MSTCELALCSAILLLTGDAAKDVASASNVIGSRPVAVVWMGVRRHCSLDEVDWKGCEVKAVAGWQPVRAAGRAERASAVGAASAVESEWSLERHGDVDATYNSLRVQDKSTAVIVGILEKQLSQMALPAGHRCWSVA